MITWRYYHQLDLSPGDMETSEDIARIVEFAESWIPQSSIARKPPYDPEDPGNPENNFAFPEDGKRIKAGELSAFIPNTYYKAERIKEGTERLLSADNSHRVREILTSPLQAHTTNFDHPDDGIIVPEGFNWEWLLVVPHDVFESYRQPWLDAGYQFSTRDSVALAAKLVEDRGWPTGWLAVNRNTKTATQYTFMPNVMDRNYRLCCLRYYAAACANIGIINCDIGGKSGLLHGNSPPWVQVDGTGNAGPWLPSPYPGDSYLCANVALVQDARKMYGAKRVTWTNTGMPKAEDKTNYSLPDYTTLRDGGIREIDDNWYGSWRSNWKLPNMVERGHFQ